MNHQITSDLTKVPLKWYVDNIKPLESNKHLSDYDFWVLLINSDCFVYLLNDEPIGFSRWVTDQHVFSSLCDLYVVPERRRQGYASRLLEHNLHHYSIAPTTKLLRYSNEASMLLYEKHGFQHTAGNLGHALMIKYAKS